MKKLILVALSLVIMLGISNIALAFEGVYYYSLSGGTKFYADVTTPWATASTWKSDLFAKIQQKDHLVSGVWNYEWVLTVLPNPGGLNIWTDFYLNDFGVKWQGVAPIIPPLTGHSIPAWSFYDNYSNPGGWPSDGHAYWYQGDPSKVAGTASFYLNSPFGPGDAPIQFSTFKDMTAFAGGGWKMWPNGHWYNNSYVASGPVPEPGTFLLLGTGLLGVGVVARIRRKK